MQQGKPRYMRPINRKGRTYWYWQPPASLREEGFHAHRLSDLERVAKQQARELNRELDAHNARKAERRPDAPPGDLPELLHTFETSRRYRGLAASTRRDYDRYGRMFTEWWREHGALPLQEIRPSHLQRWYDAIAEEHVHNALYLRRFLSRLFTFAQKTEAVTPGFNPAKLIEADPAPPPRSAVWSQADLAKFMAAADAEGRHSLALAALLSFDLCQRQGDVLSLSWEQWDGIRFDIVQRKTRKRVWPPASPRLLERLTPQPAGPVVVCESTGRAWHPDVFRHAFATMIRSAGLPALCYGDLRRSGMVALGDRNCTIVQIVAMSGHKIGQAETILETYLPPSKMQAIMAVDKAHGLKLVHSDTEAA